MERGIAQLYLGCTRENKRTIIERFLPVSILSGIVLLEFVSVATFVLRFIHDFRFQVTLYILGGIAVVSSISLAWITALMDPGVLKPDLDCGEIPTDNEREMQLQKGRKWCETCLIWRPPQSSHCSLCGFCIERYDHHCGVVGNCIGKRNHRFFILLLLMGAVGHAVMLVALLILDFQFKRDYKDTLWHHWWIYPYVIATIYAGYILVALFCFFSLQFILSSTGLTEKDVFGKGKPPPSFQFENCMNNIYEIFCSPLGPAFFRSASPLSQGKGYLDWQ